eukprot:4178606-Alexandrium_andersonii.AAC.1
MAPVHCFPPLASYLFHELVNSLDVSICLAPTATHDFSNARHRIFHSRHSHAGQTGELLRAHIALDCTLQTHHPLANIMVRHEVIGVQLHIHGRARDHRTTSARATEEDLSQGGVQGSKQENHFVSIIW